MKHRSNSFFWWGAGVAGAAAYAFLLRPTLLTWGASANEISAALPGDEVLRHPNLQTTRAITIPTSPEKAWQWLIQLGYGRGGFYSYDSLERLAGLKNLHSAEEIHPDWQNIHTGDTISISPVSPMQVIRAEPNQALVLHMLMNPFTAQVTSRSTPPFFDWTWAFILKPVNETSTRLIIRTRAEYQPAALSLLIPVLLEPVHFMMEQKMLTGIRERAMRS